MAYKLTVILILLLAFAAMGQENAPYHYSRCDVPAQCCAVPAPLMTQPVPGGTPTVVPESFVALYGIHVSNMNTPMPLETPAPTPTQGGGGVLRSTRATTVAGANGERYLQFFDTLTPPPNGTRPIGSSSWFVPAKRDRDMSVGDKRGWAFNKGIMACCSTTQDVFTAVEHPLPPIEFKGGPPQHHEGDDCGFLIQYFR